jgi:two-component system chemotaxis response regulator CheY
MFDKNTIILVVDDSSTTREHLISILKELGYESIRQAGDGESAWKVLTTANPPVQLLISDLNMPNGSGMDLLKRVRADASFQKIPFLMVTAESSHRHVLESIEAGTDNFVTKPYAKATLVAKLLSIYKKTQKK